MTRPDIPTCVDLASDRLVERFDDMFNPPGLTNFLGAAQVDHDLVAVRSINFPPLSHGDTVTGQLFVDGRLFRSFGAPVTFQWRPDCVTREAELGALSFLSVAVCPPGAAGVVVDVQVQNRGPSPCKVRLGLAIASTATRSAEPWRSAVPPQECNTSSVEQSRPAVLSVARETEGVSLQGVDVAPVRIEPRLIEVELELDPGERKRFGYVHVVDVSREDARAVFDRLARDVPAVVESARREWDLELEAMFTRGNGRFSGCLPTLSTSDDALRKLYWLGAVGVVWFKRDSPASILGRVYDTLMPRYWQTTTFIWDYALSSFVHALLDPVPMRRQLEHWISVDIHTHFGTEWQTGAPVGYWYAVNDYAMTRLVRDYVRCTGDTQFLHSGLATPTGGLKQIFEHVTDWARAWQGLRGKSGLADYGEMDNLLECVSTYVHEVASFNATNVWALRAAAEITEAIGSPGVGDRLRGEAAALAEQVKKLYVEGAGYWRAGQPDGSMMPVRHCLDFANAGSALASDLSPAQRQEMVEFFVRELQTGSWMRALSPWDPDASFSLRPDHQWNGAYPAWPPDAARALVDLGRPDVATDWLAGLAKSANQGPFGQAHFVEEAAAPVNCGARKAPPQYPYLIDWACSSSGAWVSLVVESLFGVRVPVDSPPSAKPVISDLDPDARLSGLVVKGVEYVVSTSGIQPSKE